MTRRDLTIVHYAVGARLACAAMVALACSRTNPQIHTNTTTQTPVAATAPVTFASSTAASASSAPSDGIHGALRSLSIKPGTKTVKSTWGVVSSVETHATNVGVAVLQAGGNAVDAAVAVGYALAVTHPSAGNLGGGGFLTVHFVGRATETLEFREQAPISVTQPAFDAMIERKGRGLGASGIPGTVAGLNFARARWGTKSLAELIRPAIRLARDGVPLGERQALVLSWAWPHLKQDPYLDATFGAEGQPLQRGDIVHQPLLASTLEAIANFGDPGFYSGTFAQQLVRLTSRTDIPIAASELSRYEPRLRAPLSVVYRDLLVETTPPPSAGGVAVVQLLSMLDQEHAYTSRADSPQELHLFAEAAKRAHAERRFNVVDPFGLAEYDDAELRRRWSSADTWLKPFPISRTQVTAASSLSPFYAAASEELNDTTHFSVVDSSGNVASCTTTLSGSFGARYVVPGTGVIMNNSLGAFSTVGANTLKPGRRMTSSMAPTLVSDRDGPVLVLGSPGGDTIANTIVSVFRRVVDHGQPLDIAVDAPRIHHGFVPDALRSERLRPISPALRHGLEQMGHQFTTPSRTIGDANNLARTSHGWEGYSDPREGGRAAAPKFAPSSSPNLPP
jgi:gamma-glutamyltranspeptidase / glutathione hydrolase